MLVLTGIWPLCSLFRYQDVCCLVLVSTATENLIEHLPLLRPPACFTPAVKRVFLTIRKSSAVWAAGRRRRSPLHRDPLLHPAPGPDAPSSQRKRSAPAAEGLFLAGRVSAPGPEHQQSFNKAG